MIRAATPADTSAILAMSTATGMFKPFEIDALQQVLDHFHDQAHLEGDRCFVTEEERTLQGFVYHAPEPITQGSWSLWWIVVLPGDQGKGLGGTLLKFVEDDVRQLGGQILFVETSGLPLYERTRQFYLKHGYNREASLRDYYGPGDDQVIFRRSLIG